jgi:hypothetical protein
MFFWKSVLGFLFGIFMGDFVFNDNLFLKMI